jgi:hypothetical protein
VDVAHLVYAVENVDLRPISIASALKKRSFDTRGKGYPNRAMLVSGRPVNSVVHFRTRSFSWKRGRPAVGQTNGPLQFDGAVGSNFYGRPDIQ